ncbi:hypothetical protein [Streptomyces sp. NPDC004579]|uniref:hypothetical protein n=1 Tax=Streptomyces sp. NPDC004579 TaxID=3154667 RepID=UPI0033AF1D8E
MKSNRPPKDSWDPTVHYPDLDMSDGLAEALRRGASGLGPALDGLVQGFGRAELATDRGTVSVWVAAEERSFGIAIHESGVEWASGATDDLGRARRAVAAWRGGAHLDDYAAEFPFMKVGTLARAFAEGRVADARWEELLASEYPTGGQRLLVRLASFGELRRFLPEISYGELRFTEPPPHRDGRVFRVECDGEAFRVTVRGSAPEESREYTLGDLAEVARRIAGFFAAD